MAYGTSALQAARSITATARTSGSVSVNVTCASPKAYLQDGICSQNGQFGTRMSHNSNRLPVSAQPWNSVTAGRTTRTGTRIRSTRSSPTTMTTPVMTVQMRRTIGDWPWNREWNFSLLSLIFTLTKFSALYQYWTGSDQYAH